MQLKAKGTVEKTDLYNTKRNPPGKDKMTTRRNLCIQRS